MPNMTGAFFDQNPNVEVDYNDPEEVQTEIDNAQITDLRIAAAQSTPEIEFISMPFAAGMSRSLKLLDYDASRVSVAMNSQGGNILVSAIDLSAIVKQGASFGAVFTNMIPAVPTAFVGYPPLVLHTQQELWFTNAGTSLDIIYLSITRYSSGV